MTDLNKLADALAEIAFGDRLAADMTDVAEAAALLRSAAGADVDILMCAIDEFAQSEAECALLAPGEAVDRKNPDPNHITYIETDKAREKQRAAIESDLRLLVAQVPRWLPISEAPEGVLCMVFWRDDEDYEEAGRYDFDSLSEGVWTNYFEEHEHYKIAGAAIGNSEDAPYTHYMPLPPAPKEAETS